jgi:chromosome segregation ATPase
MQAAHDERVAAYEADTAQLLADAEEKALSGSSAQKRQISAATAAHKDTEEKLKAEQTAHSALKEESGKLLEGVQAQMGGAVSQLTVQVKELSAKLGTTSKQLADADKERKLYIEAVRMLKLRLTDSDAKVKDFVAKRMLYENEIERLSEWVAEHTIAAAKVTSELENVPQASVEKWLTQLETSRHKVKSWRERLKEEMGDDTAAPVAQAALKRMLEEVRQAMRAEVRC